jgi:DNA-binding PadR family transcriptional regulator
MTLQTQLVLEALLEDPARERYGLELCDVVGLASGTIYPILARFEQVGWVQSTWEDPAVHEAEGRPRRRLYRLTSDGAEQGRAALARVHRAGRRPSAGWRLAGGQP